MFKLCVTCSCCHEVDQALLWQQRGVRLAEGSAALMRQGSVSRLAAGWLAGSWLAGSTDGDAMVCTKLLCCVAGLSLRHCGASLAFSAAAWQQLAA